MTAPSIVLLHGVGLDHTMWRPVVTRLSGEFAVLTPDLPGHGGRAPVPADLSLRELADRVADEIPPGSHVVGFSLGALAAQHLARFRPELVRTLTCVSSVCRRTPEERAAVLDRLALAERDFAGSAAASIERWYAGTDVDQATVDRTRQVLLANDVGSFLACYRVFAAGDADIGLELGRITAPALAITGELDGGSTPSMSERLAQVLPDCRVQIVPGARHMLPVQEPDAFVTAITTFIRESS
ncbi:alpha/beta fold hydrolase [Nakamurella flava]|uniref:Alpha/beta fold hydrolase n=1 Tax=Nakamurella flava TaxID=2576308 RepID=A0A4U6QCB9_9ACTN|nr:alpha/beta fold hydrolase [Nakamurella flava]TKV57757.1 alpha/beta fold hydrolase [Nakamurella flava]